MLDGIFSILCVCEIRCHEPVGGLTELNRIQNATEYSQNAYERNQYI